MVDLLFVRRVYSITLTFIFVCMACTSKLRLHTPALENSRYNTEIKAEAVMLQDSLIRFGMNYLRVPYRYGGTTPRGFDCSGFTGHVYKNFGYDLGRSSRDQAGQFPTVKKKDLKQGDLVFFEGRSRNGRVGHVGIVTETKPGGEFNFIHASVQSGVIVSASTEAYYASRYLKAGRVIENSTVYNARNNGTEISVNDRKNTDMAVRSEAPVNIVDAVYHTVKKGDNLTDISKKYDVPISTIQHLNGLTSKQIKRGQRLLIIEAVSIPAMPVAEVYHFIDGANTIPNSEYSETAGEKESEQWVITSSQAPAKIKTETTERSIVTSEEITSGQETVILPDHQVKTGESLYSIARKYNLSVNELKELNHITTNNITPGQTLIVGRLPLETDRERPKAATDNITVYTVKKGDTLYSIARLYNCSVYDLKRWNESVSDAIKIGDKIRIER